MTTFLDIYQVGYAMRTTPEPPLPAWSEGSLSPPPPPDPEFASALVASPGP